MKRVWNVRDLPCLKFPPRRQASYKVALEIAKQKICTIGKKRLWNAVCWKQWNNLEKVVRQTWDEYHFQRHCSEGHFRYAGRCERPGDKWNKSISNSNVFFTWMSQQMLLHVLSCLFSWDIFIQETLKRSSYFVRNGKLQQADVREK